MLDANPLMIDIDIDHWRNLHKSLLRPIRGRRRIVVIHDNGKVQNISHSDGKEVHKTIATVVEPGRDARVLYEANKADVDLVMLLERRTVERYYHEVFEGWHPEEDLDAFIHRMYSSLDTHMPGIVTFPGPPSRQLGLQWSLPWDYQKVVNAVERFVPAACTVIIAVFDDVTNLWTSLVLGFDDRKKITLISSLDKTLVKKDWKQEHTSLTKWVDGRFWKCELGIFVSKGVAKRILLSADPAIDLLSCAVSNDVLIDPCPNALSTLISKFSLHDLS